jgi:hypothetical protein
MPRTCTVCSHPDRPAIDAALLAGEPFRHIAARTGTSTGALQRHKEEHLPAVLLHAKEAEQVAQADDLLAQVRDLQRRTLSILDGAEKSGDRRTALAAIREARGNLELLGRLAGDLQEGQIVNVVVSPEWQRVRAAVITALTPYPEARVAVAGHLLALEAGDGHRG